MNKDPFGDPEERRHSMRRGRSRKVTGPWPGITPMHDRKNRAEASARARPDFTRAETYMTEQAPSVADPKRIGADVFLNEGPIDTTSPRSKAMRIAVTFMMAAVAMAYLSSAYGPIVDAVAGVLAAFAIAATIHILRPRPMLRFMLVVIALACLSITFAMTLHLHLHSPQP